MSVARFLRAPLRARADSPVRFALTVAGGYALVGLTWIALSDRAVKYVVDHVQHLTWLQTAKGWAFVLVTASLLAVLVYRRARALRQSQEALASSYENLRAVLESTPIPTFVLDDAGLVQHWNGAAQELLGWTADEIVGRPCPVLLDDPAWGVTNWLERSRAGEHLRELEVRIQPKRGQAVDVALVMAPLEDRGNAVSGVVVMAEDLAERRKLEHLRRQRDRMRHEAEAMHEAVGVIGHELRTPLAALRATVEYIRSDVEAVPDEASQLLHATERQVGQLTDMVENMLEAARLNSGAARFHWADVTWRRVCDEAVDIVRPLIDPRRVTLETEVTPADLTMRGDAHALRRLLVNLLSNAHKHTASGTIRIAVREATEGDTRWVELRVTDTGKGIPPEMADKLGRAFALNSGSVGAQRVSGAGLGLAICREIAGAHGGNLQVHSRRGEGTTFTALLRADMAGPVTEAVAGDIATHIAA